MQFQKLPEAEEHTLFTSSQKGWHRPWWQQHGTNSDLPSWWPTQQGMWHGLDTYSLGGESK